MLTQTEWNQISAALSGMSRTQGGIGSLPNTYVNHADLVSFLETFVDNGDKMDETFDAKWNRISDEFGENEIVNDNFETETWSHLKALLRAEWDR